MSEEDAKPVEQGPASQSSSPLPPDVPQNESVPPVEYGPPMPPDYKQTSIVVLIVMLMTVPLSCCFCGYGIPSFAGAACAIAALIQSSSVSDLYMHSDFEGAEKMSRTVKKWLVASVIVPVVVTIMMMVMAVLFFGGMAALEWLGGGKNN